MNGGEIWYSDWEKTELLAQADVIVVGGGPAGVAAAEAAGREGRSVILLEKQGFLGGQAVGGLSATICGLYLTNENWKRENGPRQLVFGFAERFRQVLRTHNGLREAQLYGNTYVDAHEPFAWKCAAEELLLQAGVTILYHTALCGARTEQGEIQELMVLTGRGFYRVRASRYIDASGDGVLTAAAGGSFRFGQNGIVQNPSLIFKLSNVDGQRFWDYYGENTICHDDFSQKISQAEQEQKSFLPRKKIWAFHCVDPNEVYINATSVPAADGGSLNCVDPQAITFAEIHGRKQAEDYIRFLRAYIPGCEQAHMGEHGAHIGVRQTRSACCLTTLRDSDVENCRKFSDGIARSAWPIELHRGAAPKLFWMMNDYYEIPYGVMVPVGFHNLLVAGRCIDAEHQALASSRVTAQCFSMGEAAGLAAVLSLQMERGFDKVRGDEVRQALNRAGARLDEPML